MIEPQNEIADTMNFRRIGGSYQLTVRTLDDLQNALRLDAAHWALTSAAIDSFRADPQFLNFIDDDQNGQIRVDEVKRAIQWFLSVIRRDPPPELGSDRLPLEAINRNTPEGQALYDAARVVLANLGEPDSATLSLDQIRNDKEIIGLSSRNGDGVITPEGITGDASLAARLRSIIDTTGGCGDLSGTTGIDGKLLDRFVADAEAFLAWHDAPEKQPETLLPFGDDTETFYGMFQALRERLDHYYLNCAALAFLPAGSERLVKVDAAADVMNAAAVNAFLETVTIATPNAACELDFDAPLNPLFAAALRTFAAAPAMRAFLSGRKLGMANWEALKARFVPYETWLKAEPGNGVFEKFAPAELRAMLGDGGLEELRRLISADLAVSQEISACTTLLKLVLFFHYLTPFLNNFVTLYDLFNPKFPAMLQIGRLVMDGRHFTLATTVRNIAEHKRIAALSDICVAYVEISTGKAPALRKMTLAVAITSGNMQNIFPGKRGVFFTADDTAWDANVIDFIQQPVSVSEALKMPFYRFGDFVSKQADKFFSSKSADAQKLLEKNIASGTFAPAPAPVAPVPGQQTPAFSGSMLLMGGGIGIAAIGSAVAFIVKSLQNISVLNVLAVLFGIMLIFGGPMVAISLVKLYRRNMSRFLEANACAVNRPMRLSRKMGVIFTFTPPLPKSSLIREDLVNVFYVPVRTRSHRLLTVLLAVLLLVAAVWGFRSCRDFRADSAAPRPAAVESKASPVAP